MIDARYRVVKRRGLYWPQRRLPGRFRRWRNLSAFGFTIGWGSYRIASQICHMYREHDERIDQ
jgi:hypothetical protein